MERKDLLKAYIEKEILPRYTHFDKAHQLDHITTVIRQSEALADMLARKGIEVDRDMVYVIAAYHDLGIVNGRENHHIDSGKILMADPVLPRYFTEEQLLTMKEAVEDHRASSKNEPRSIYGRIVAEADRQILELGIRAHVDLLERARIPIGPVVQHRQLGEELDALQGDHGVAFRNSGL